MIPRIATSLLIVCTFWAAGAHAITTPSADAAAIAENLRLQLQAERKTHRAGAVTLQSAALLRRFYAERGYLPAWPLPTDGGATLTETLLQALADAADEGLQPDAYRLAAIRAALRSQYRPGARERANLDLLLSDAFLTYARHLSAGRTDPQRLHRHWTWQNREIDVVAVLQNALARKDLSPAWETLRPPHAEYRKLKQALAHYRELQRLGGWPTVSPGKKLEQGSISPRVAELRARLRASGDLAAFTDQEAVFDPVLQQAVLRFQARHGLLQDGIVGPRTLAALNVPVAERVRQLELNLERWRWLPEDLGERHILVNIPAFEMHLVEGGRRVFHSKVIVGTAERRTPVFSGQMSHLVFSPYWNVPRSIAVKDKLPILRRNPHALKRSGIRVFSGGREINPGQIDWRSVSARNFSYRLRQDPGRKNALGKVKFMFPNRHNVYLHDTSTPKLFERPQRTFSSGCVRVAKPLELAEQLLKSQPRWSRQAIEAAAGKRRERTVRLEGKVPVHLLYWTAWQADDGTVHFREDIYRQDRPLVQALDEHAGRAAG